MNLSLKIIDVNCEEQWDEFVSKSVNGTIYHSSKWMKIVNLSPLYKHQILGIYNGIELCAGLVWVEKKNLNFTSAVTPLGSAYIGFVLGKTEATKLSDRVSFEHSVIKEGLKYLETKYAEINLVMSPGLEDFRPFKSERYSVIPQMTYYLDFFDSEKLWSSFDGALRRQINKAEKESFIFDNIFTPDEFFQILSSSFERKNNKFPIPREIIEGAVLEKCLKDGRFMFAARDKSSGKLSAGIIFLYDHKRCYYSFAGTAAEYISTGVQPWLILKSLDEIRKSGITILDFVGANIPSIAKFKENFNPSPVNYFKVEKYISGSLKMLKAVVKKIKK